MMQVVIIGTRLADFACAHALAQASVPEVVFDKRRGTGGRVAIRRAGDVRFGHGAPYVTAKGAALPVDKRGMSGMTVGLDVRICPQIEDAWTSGTAIAKDLLEQDLW